jgi:glycosyltransferase involved in cell wall biosynthesis
MKKINVIHIIPNLKSGGAERLTLDICTYLSKNIEFNLKLLLIYNDIEFNLLENINIYLLNEKCSLSILKKNTFNTNEINSILNSFKPDIIHTHLFEAEILGRYKLLKDCVYISHIHDNIKQYSTNLNFFKKNNLTNLFEKKWIYKSYKSVDNKFIVISNDSKQYCKKLLPKKLKKNIHFLPNAIDFQKFYHEKSIESSASTLKIISVGSLVEKKNHRFLIEIAKEFRIRDVKFEINIFGNGPLFLKLQSEIKENKLEKYIFLHGKTLNIEKELKKSDYFIHPATYEPFGLVILEAMASGLPVIALNGRGNKDLIKHGRNGYIFDNQQASEFVNVILNLEEDKELKKSIIKNGQDTAKKYNLESYMVNLITLYKKFIKEKSTTVTGKNSFLSKKSKTNFIKLLK